MKKGACPLPADPFIVSEFLLGLADAGNNRASTIRRKCASISAIHRYGYFDDPTKHPEVKIAIRKTNRRLGTRFKQARPINRHMLDKMLDVCGDDLRGIRNRMILLFAYTTLRRRSELTSLRVEDWTQCGDGHTHPTPSKLTARTLNTSLAGANKTNSIRCHLVAHSLFTILKRWGNH